MTEPLTTAGVLADIEAARLLSGPDLGECLEALANIVRTTSHPAAVLAWAMDMFGRETLRHLARQYRITLHETRAEPDDQPSSVTVIWVTGGAGIAIIPAGQKVTTTLLQLREHITERDEAIQGERRWQAAAQGGAGE
ncbi:hypothetical protein ACFWN1_05675 [Streptomyces sp. NPDC058459]|uniref:hypothetical protein n=1 Tax=Streptomyces sp. NPDC058459 TaxID=3346508 RepID=UPI003667E1AE